MPSGKICSDGEIKKLLIQDRLQYLSETQSQNIKIKMYDSTKKDNFSAYKFLLSLTWKFNENLCDLISTQIFVTEVHT